MAQLNFKILNIEEKHESQKEMRRKYICNLLFTMVQNVDKEDLFYPLRALTEFYLEEDNERALSKRLNAESLLSYKNFQGILGREIQLLDLNKRNLSYKKGVLTVESGYKYLFADTLNLIRGVISRLE